ncbi:MAG: DUF3267 domain-containing protein [Balneolaceae bacterium]|nr:DUF3267 domain-containing protein [Balneolaceae bacterium]
MKRDYSIPAGEANLKSLLVVLPMAVVLVFAYQQWYGWQQLLRDMELLYSHYLISLGAIIGGIILHELIHAIVWVGLGSSSWEQVTFGFNLKGLAPYAHLGEPVKISVYRAGTLAPGLILGLLPYLAGLVGGIMPLVWFGYLFTIVAGGDFLMVWLIRDIKKGSMVQDHPERIGCVVVEERFGNQESGT